MTVEFLSLADCHLAYQRQVGRKNAPGLLFLSGFASDMEGTKASFFAQQCQELNLSFVRFDYRGCGQSEGLFAEGTIGAWREDSLAVLDRLTEGPQIIVGSSMGGWLGLLLAQARPERIRAWVGLAAAPDFTEDLVWDKMNEAERAVMQREGAWLPPDSSDVRSLPWRLNLIEDGRKHLVLRQPLALDFPVRLFQGMQDQAVPWRYATRLAEHITGEDVRLTLIKNADHRLSAPEELKLVWETVAALL